MSIYKKQNGNLERLAGGVSVLNSNELYYNPGDKEDFTVYSTIFTTGVIKLLNNKRIYFQVSFPKRLDRISSINLSFEILHIRIGAIPLFYKVLDGSNNAIKIKDFPFFISGINSNNVFFRLDFNDGNENLLTTLLDGNDPEDLFGYLEFSFPTFTFN